MNTDKFPELIERAGGSLAEKLGAMREKAEHVIAEHVELMKAEGSAVELGEDELRLLKAYRAFKARNPANTVQAMQKRNIEDRERAEYQKP